MKKFTYVLLILFLGCSDDDTQDSTSNSTAEMAVVQETDTESASSIFPSKDELLLMDSEELMILKNEVFAKHGYIFKSENLDSVFRTKKWYIPSKKNVDEYLTDDEIDFIKQVKEIEGLKLKYANDRMIESELTRIVEEFSFPIKISRIVKKIGKPDSTFIDDNITCPIGQLHFWNSEGLTFLEDNYDSIVSYNNNARLFITTKSILIGKAKKDIEFILNNEELIFNVINSSNSIELFLYDVPSESVVIEKDGLFIILRFDKDLKVKYIMISTFDINKAC